MATTIIDMPRDPHVDIPIPPHPDGADYWSFCMTFDDFTRVAYSDSVTELIGCLIENYDDIPLSDTESALTIRLQYLINARGLAQAQLLRELELEGVVRHTTEEEEELLHTPMGHTPDVGPVWACATPIVLVEDMYAPHTELVRPVAQPREPGVDPASTIFWVEADNETRFLESLDRIGRIRLYPAAELADAATA